MEELDKLFQEKDYIRNYETLDGVISYCNSETGQTISFNSETQSMELLKYTGETNEGNELYGIVNLNIDIILIIDKMIKELGWKNLK